MLQITSSRVGSQVYLDSCEHSCRVESLEHFGKQEEVVNGLKNQTDDWATLPVMAREEGRREACVTDVGHLCPFDSLCP